MPHSERCWLGTWVVYVGMVTQLNYTLEAGKARLLVLICSTRSAMMAHLTLVCSLFSFDTTENRWKQEVNFEMMMVFTGDV